MKFMSNLFTGIYSGGGGVKLMKHFKGDTSYRNLGIYGLEKQLHVGHCPVPVLVFDVHDV
jgi:hypothetical protein